MSKNFILSSQSGAKEQEYDAAAFESNGCPVKPFDQTHHPYAQETAQFGRSRPFTNRGNDELEAFCNANQECSPDELLIDDNSNFKKYLNNDGE